MRGTPFGFSGWHLGLNTIDSPYTLDEGEARECLNVVSTERGAIKKRTGSTQFDKEASRPNVELISLAPVNTAGGMFLLASGGTNLYSINSAGEWSTIGEGFTSGKQWSIVQFEKGTAKTAGPVYLVNGTDKAQYWSGAEKATKVKEWESEKGEFEKKELFETAPYTPQGKYMTVGLGGGGSSFLFMANISGDTSAVRFTELKKITAGGEKPDPTLWPKENVIRFDPEDGYEITGIAKCGLYVLVFKPYKTWVIHSAAPIANRKLSSNIGCVSHRSIVETPQGCYFLTADQGVYLTNGSTLKEMSYNVRPTLLKINAANREKAAAAYFNNHYYISFPYETSTSNNRTLDYDVVLKSWWLHDLAGNQWAIMEPSEGEPFLFTIRPKTKDGIAKAFVPGIFQDIGVNYTGNGVLGAFWVSPWEPFYYFIFRHRVKAPFVKKRVRQMFFQGSGQIIPFVYKNFRQGREELPGVVNNNEMFKPEHPINFATETEKWGEGPEKWGEGELVWGGEAETGSARMYSLGVAQTWSFGFGNSSSEPFEVDTVTLMAQFRKS